MPAYHLTGTHTVLPYVAHDPHGHHAADLRLARRARRVRTRQNWVGALVRRIRTADLPDLTPGAQIVR